MDIKLVSNVITFPSSDTRPDVSFTARTEEGKAFYASTRIGDIKRTPSGYEVVIPEPIVKSFEGSSYRFKEISAMKCLQEGTLLPADAAAEAEGKKGKRNTSPEKAEA
ncbi:MAG TPA: hypothetical protein VHO03_03635 [Ignavibacteriales bacterium]|nr:hypothetical protein [Ignavibacteriales bacterium]